MSKCDYPYSLFTDYFLNNNAIDFSIPRKVEVINARSLICPKRFDLMAKLIYIHEYEEGNDVTHAVNIYKDNINAFSYGSFIELGSEDKCSFEEYVKQFNSIIDSIKKNGFDPKKSLVPVGNDGVICDGAHRVAVAAYFNKNISIVRFPELQRKYDYSYFRRALMSDINMGYMAAYYTRLMSQYCKLAMCIFPKRSKKSDIIKLLEKYGEIVYEQDIFLSNEGKKELINRIEDLDSVALFNTKASFLSEKFKSCEGLLMHTILLDEKKWTKINDLINELDEKYSLYYVTDNSEETQSLVQFFYDAKKLDKLNNSKGPLKYQYKCISNRNEFLIRNNMYGYGEDPYIINLIRIIIKWKSIKKILSLIKRSFRCVKRTI